ncbi:MAG: GtrA family protein [Muribaculaceae bacterium]|nr:GtrA family protein [Muribaculaceae bacterium]
MADCEKETEASSDSWYRRLWHKVLTSDALIFTFLRSGVSSQCAGWLDMIVGFILFAWAGLSPALATAIGAVCGGILNCFMCYRFTFRSKGVDWRAVMVKYIIIWIGGVALNSYGTEWLFYLIHDWDWLEELGFKRDGYYAAARLTVSLLVSWFWNFPMQRCFVYVPSWFDRYAVAFVAFLGIKRKNKQKPE